MHEDINKNFINNQELKASKVCGEWIVTTENLKHLIDGNEINADHTA